MWEAAALSAEEEHVKSVEDDLTFQIVQLQLQLEAKNERFDKEYAAATGELEGAISAVRAMTHEIVRTLDEAAAIVPRGRSAADRLRCQQAAELARLRVRIVVADVLEVHDVHDRVRDDAPDELTRDSRRRGSRKTPITNAEAAHPIRPRPRT